MFFRQILFFLTYFDKLLKLTNEIKKDPKWLSCYNFMSLLNIPETLENFGPLKNFWEGSYIGEKFITQTKTEFFGKRNNWTYAMLQRIQKKSIFEQMIDEKIEKKTNNFARYKNIIHLQNDITARRPIQCYYWNKNQIFFIVLDETSKNISYVEIHVEKNKQTVMKVNYFEWDLKTKIYSTEDKMTDVTACLLLPNLSHNTEKIFYCCIRKDWKVLQQDGFDFIGL